MWYCISWIFLLCVFLFLYRSQEINTTLVIHNQCVRCIFFPVHCLILIFNPGIWNGKALLQSSETICRKYYVTKCTGHFNLCLYWSWQFGLTDAFTSLRPDANLTVVINGTCCLPVSPAFLCRHVPVGHYRPCQIKIEVSIVFGRLIH